MSHTAGDALRIANTATPCPYRVEDSNDGIGWLAVLTISALYRYIKSKQPTDLSTGHPFDSGSSHNDTISNASKVGHASLQESKQGKASTPKYSHHEVVEISTDEDEDVALPSRKSGAHKLVKSPVKSKAPAVAVATGAGPLSRLSARAQFEKERLARQKRLHPNPSPPPPESDDASDDTSDTDGSARKKNPALPAYRARHPPLRDLGNKKELVFTVLSAFVSDPAWLYAFFDPGTPVVLVGHLDDADSRKNALKNIFPNWVRVCPPLRDCRGYMHMKYVLLFEKDGGLRVVVGTVNLVPMDWRDIENVTYTSSTYPSQTEPHRRRYPVPANAKGESFPAMLEHTLRATGVDEGLRIMQMQGTTASRSRPRRTTTTGVPSAPRSSQALRGLGRKGRGVDVLGCAAEGATGASDSKKGKATAAKEEWGVELECLTSSIGMYTLAWLAAFRLCAARRARPFEKWLDRTKGRGKGEFRRFRDAGIIICRGAGLGVTTPALAFTSNATTASLFLQHGTASTFFSRTILRFPPRLIPASFQPTHSHLSSAPTPVLSPTMRILFPTLATVRATVLGEAGAGTVFCRRGQWTGFAKGGVQALFSDAKSRSGEVGMHTKSEFDSDIEIIEVKPAKGKGKVKEPEPEPKPCGWMYVGSYNFTLSAWGTLSGSSFNPVINATNYELGVVIPLGTRAEADAAVAWQRRARKYGPRDVSW
ncbi:hypothetical protein C8J57DRAFT_1484924, partial [Mycena rebaudengoi]